MAMRSQTGTLWHLFSGKIMQMPVCTWTFLLKIGATNHPGKGLDPPPKRAMPKWTEIFFRWGFPNAKDYLNSGANMSKDLGKHHYKKISVHLGIARLGGGV